MNCKDSEQACANSQTLQSESRSSDVEEDAVRSPAEKSPENQAQKKLDSSGRLRGGLSSYSRMELCLALIDTDRCTARQDSSRFGLSLVTKSVTNRGPGAPRAMDETPQDETPQDETPQDETPQDETPRIPRKKPSQTDLEDLDYQIANIGSLFSVSNPSEIETLKNVGMSPSTTMVNRRSSLDKQHLDQPPKMVKRGASTEAVHDQPPRMVLRVESISDTNNYPAKSAKRLESRSIIDGVCDRPPKMAKRVASAEDCVVPLETLSTSIHTGAWDPSTTHNYVWS